MVNIKDIVKNYRRLMFILYLNKIKLYKKWLAAVYREVLMTSPQVQSTRVESDNNSYRVASANFSQRKIGHAHDNSADSENVAGASQPNVHAHFIFRFENGPGNQSCFSIHDQNTAERVNHKLSRRTIDAPWTGRVREAYSGP